jgi:protein-disulfide isomerase
MTCWTVLLVVVVTLLSVLSTVTACDTRPSTDGPLKIVIYTDFQCGACGRLSSEVEPELRARYVDTGKAQIEIRLPGAGDDSLRAVQAALCASDQGRFIDYQDALFHAWRDSEEDPETFSMDELVALAASLGLDAAAFRSCLESGDKEAQVEKNMDLARADGVQTLPAVLVGNARVEGYKPLDVYLKVINQALKDS